MSPVDQEPSADAAPIDGPGPGVQPSATKPAGKRGCRGWWPLPVMLLVCASLIAWYGWPRHGTADAMGEVVAKFGLSQRLASCPIDGEIRWRVRDPLLRVYEVSGRCRSIDAYVTWRYGHPDAAWAQAITEGARFRDCFTERGRAYETTITKGPSGEWRLELASCPLRD